MGIFILVALLGWGVGILVNYLADVLPILRRLSLPVCLACKAPIELRDYLVLIRRCKACGKPRNLRSWIVQISALGVVLWVWLIPTTRLNFPVSVVLLVYFGLVVVIDLEHRLILHPVSLVGVVLGLGVGTWLHGVRNTLIGGAAGFLIMLALYFLGIWILKLFAKWRKQTLADEEALGFGDVNLSGVLGLILGWPGITGGLILAILLGGLVSLIYLLVMVLTRRYQSFTAIPYGPFLIASATLLLFFPGLILT